jgi:hypothetical protein
MAKQSPRTDKPTPAEFLAALAKRGVTLNSDGMRVWPTGRGALTVDEDKFADEHNAAIVALLTEKPNAAESRP